MKANYYNWMPKGVIAGFGAVCAGLAVGAVLLWLQGSGTAATVLAVVLTIGAVGCGLWTACCKYAFNQFSYEGKRQLSRQIIEGVAEHITLPENGKGLDVGCGSGALTIACAKRNPQGTMLGVDVWGPEYAHFSQETCERNAKAEGVSNTAFEKGNAIQLPFEDESFDAVTSNYVYHNIVGKNKQVLLLETLRVLKKGGTFAIHDLISRTRYGDMQAFRTQLLAMGYEQVELIDTTNGILMSKSEARRTMLTGSTLLVGKK